MKKLLLPLFLACALVAVAADTKVDTAKADLIVACDGIVAAGKSTLALMREGRSFVALNSHATPTAAMVGNPDWQHPAGSCEAALAEAVGRLPARPLALVCGMLNTKDIKGYLRPLAVVADQLVALSIPGEANTLPADVTAAAAAEVGLKSSTAPDAITAIRTLAANLPGARILICGSLYLAGNVLRENG